MVSKAERNYFLDITRGVVACWVMFYHFGQARSYPEWYEALISYGWLGVPIFFVISGYSIGISIDRTKHFHSFLIKRFARIYPAYWISLLLIALLIISQKLITGNNSVVAFPKSIIGLLNSVLCLYKPFTNTDITNWVYWTLIYEIFFYLIFSFTFFIHLKYRQLYFITIAGLSIFFPYLLNFKVLFFLKLVGYFCIGISLNEMAKKQWLVAFVLVVLSAISIYQNKIYCIGADNKLASIGGLIAALIFALSVFIFSGVFNHKTKLSKLGDLSYGIYLFHIPLGIYLINVIGVSKFIYFDNLFVIYDLLIFSFILLFSWFVYVLVEYPCMQFFKKY